MKEVTKALADQKVCGRRMVIEEVEGSSEDEESTATAIAGQQLSSTLELTDSHTQGLVNNTDTEPTQEHLTDETVEQDSQVLQHNVDGGGDADGSAGTEASSQPPSVTAEGDAASPDDNMPPAVLSLKDAGNELFRKGQYSDALDKYNAAVQLLG